MSIRLACGLLVGMCSAHAAEFHIDAGEAAQTLVQFAAQADLQILYDFGEFRNIRTRGIHGEMDWRAALSAMLIDIPWMVSPINGRTLALVNYGSRRKGFLIFDGADFASDNGYLDCAPLRYTVTLGDYSQFRDDGRRICVEITP